MKKIRLIQNAYIEGYEGAFLREVKAGTNKDLSSGWWDQWYTASARDVDGNSYTVYWCISNYDPEQCEDDVDWDSPIMIIADDDGRNVINEVEIEHNEFY